MSTPHETQTHAGATPVSDGSSAVELRNVCKGYGEAWERQEVISDLSLVIQPGELTAVIGASGCGKSTLVNLIAGFERPESGEILLDAKPVTGPSHDRMVVFQETALLPWLTAAQNVAFGPKIRGDMAAEELAQEVSRLLDKVGLTEFKDKYPLQLSGGTGLMSTHPPTDKRIAVWDWSDGRLETTLEAPNGFVSDLVFDPRAPGTLIAP